VATAGRATRRSERARRAAIRTRSRADALILGDSYKVYYDILSQTGDLKKSLGQREQAAVAAAKDQQSTTTRTMIIAAVLGALAVLGRRRPHRPPDHPAASPS
jgi:hypothetical protein